MTQAFAAERALAAISLKGQLAHKFNWVIGIILGGGSLLVGMALWHHLLRDNSMAGYDWEAMRAYVVIGFVTITLAYGGAHGQVAERIVDGTVAIDLTRPVDFQRARAAEYIGSMIASLPTAVIGSVGAWLLFTPPAPASPLAGALTAFSILMLFPLSFEIVYLSALLCFWTRRYGTIMFARETLVGFFSGAMIPLALMPSWLQVLAWCLPFPHFTTTPSSIYLGRVDTVGALGLIAAEAAWAVGLWVLARVLWRHAVRQVTIHGG
ncbi:ABC transporter permease [Glycomyces rhizosphaerae]|uniref:ABC transporter permease n=1 Tax=Glycomyces rhizosphaerae TaxID=2054422 RepID=A0ABV7Q5W0_9ACTN